MKTITLSDGITTAIVDDEDFEKVNAKVWHASKKVSRPNAKTYAKCGTQDLQRFLIPVIPEGHIVRFANENSLDCRRENLVIVHRKDGNTFKNFDRSKHVKTNIENKEKESVKTIKQPPVPQKKTENFIGVHPEVVTKIKFIDGVMQPVEETWYVAQYTDSNNRIYNFGRYRDPKIAAIEYNKQLKLVALGLDEEVELNPKEALA